MKCRLAQIYMEVQHEKEDWSVAFDEYPIVTVGSGADFLLFGFSVVRVPSGSAINKVFGPRATTGCLLHVVVVGAIRLGLHLQVALS